MQKTLHWKKMNSPPVAAVMALYIQLNEQR